MSKHLPLKDHIFISEFAAYARGRGEVGYDYGSLNDCACAQFLRDTGRSANPSVGGEYWRNRDLPFPESLTEYPLPKGVAGALQAGTFDLLATRLESLLSDMTVGVGK